jgi:hypothetical protein
MTVAEIGVRCVDGELHGVPLHNHRHSVRNQFRNRSRTDERDSSGSLATSASDSAAVMSFPVVDQSVRRAICRS